MAPGAYRVEVSPNNRAVCRNTECKKQGLKLEKGMLRFGTFVTIMEHQTWHYKHWGCVSPKQIDNIKESIEGDLDMFDGYDELPEDLQEKVRKALDDGHVDDDDWRGDKEMNRPGMNGFRKTKKMLNDEAKAAEKAEEGTGHAETPKKKRRRVKDDPDAADDGDEPLAKKSKAKAKSQNGSKMNGNNAVGASEDKPLPGKKGRKSSKKTQAHAYPSMDIKEESSDHDAVPEVSAEKNIASAKDAAPKDRKAESETSTTIKGETANSDAEFRPPAKKARLTRKTVGSSKINYKDVESDGLSDVSEANEEDERTEPEAEENSEVAKPKKGRKKKNAKSGSTAVAGKKKVDPGKTEKLKRRGGKSTRS